MHWLLLSGDMNYFIFLSARIVLLTFTIYKSCKFILSSFLSNFPFDFAYGYCMIMSFKQYTDPLYTLSMMNNIFHDKNWTTINTYTHSIFKTSRNEDRNFGINSILLQLSFLLPFLYDFSINLKTLLKGNFPLQITFKIKETLLHAKITF